MKPHLSALLELRTSLRRLFRVSEWQSLLLWAMVAGAVGACATEVFRLALRAVDQTLFGQSASLVAIARSLPWYGRLMVPALGGLAGGGLLVLARRSAARKA